LKRASSSGGVDMDGVCITYTRSQPPSSARILDHRDHNVFIGAFPPHTDHWLAADNDHPVNDLFEKVMTKRGRPSRPHYASSPSVRLLVRLSRHLFCPVRAPNSKIKKYEELNGQ